MHPHTLELRLSSGPFYPRLAAAMAAAALRFKHATSIVFRALELLSHGKTDTVKDARNSGGFLRGACNLKPHTVPTSQLAKLVGERVGGVGEAPNSPTCV